MAIENAGFKEATRDRLLPAGLPPAELLPGTATLESLKVPDEVLLRPESVGPFLASQCHRLIYDVIKPDELKSQAAEIPEYLHDDHLVALQSSPLTREEQGALQSWQEEMSREGGLLNLASGDIDDLNDRIGAYVDEAMQSGRFQSNPSGNSAVDAFDMMFTSSYFQESEEIKKKWQELVAAARSPEMVLALMEYRKSQFLAQKMGRLLEMHKYNIDALDQLSADLELKNFRGDLSAVDLATFNANFARTQGDATQLFQLIQQTMNEYERGQQFTITVNRQVGQGLESIIRNMR